MAESIGNLHEVLAVDILSEIESKVRLQISLHYAKNPDLSAQEEESLKYILFSDIGSELLSDYAEKGVKVKGISYIRTHIEAAQTYLEGRAMYLDHGFDFEIPQHENEMLTAGYERAGMTGMSVHQQGFSAEDSQFGLRPSGGHYPGTMGEDGQVYNEIKLRSSDARSRKLAAQKPKYDGKSVEDILKILPRKHKIAFQTFELDVERTLRESGFTSEKGYYFRVEKALQQERDDPVQKDLLLRKYAEIELGKVFLNQPAAQLKPTLNSGSDPDSDTLAATVETDDE